MIDLLEVAKPSDQDVLFRLSGLQRGIPSRFDYRGSRNSQPVDIHPLSGNLSGRDAAQLSGEAIDADYFEAHLDEFVRDEN